MRRKYWGTNSDVWNNQNETKDWGINTNTNNDWTSGKIIDNDWTKKTTNEDPELENFIKGTISNGDTKKTPQQLQHQIRQHQTQR